jgi:sugar phosphate isomerase/epimerase
MNTIFRRDFLHWTAAASLSGALAGKAFAQKPQPAQQDSSATHLRLGLVTYNWGRDWTLPTVIENCEQTGFEGVELRSTHKHGVEISLSKAARKEVAQRFADSPVELVGLGSACEYHSPDKAVLAKNIEETKAFIMLCHDVGGSGVKVRPNGLPQDVPVEKTLTQIGKALNEVGEFGAKYGVQIRLEVHGRETAHVPHIDTIMEVADNPQVTVCWNCNQQDLAGEGLRHNYNLVKDRMGTIHIHDLRTQGYPWQELFALLKQTEFSGWTLLEDGKVPSDIVAAMKENRAVWEKLVAG